MPDSYRDRYEARTAIARRRQELDITQAELARRAGISVTTLHRLESGADANPRIVTLLALSMALECRPNDLVQSQWVEAAVDQSPDHHHESARALLRRLRRQRAVE